MSENSKRIIYILVIIAIIAGIGFVGFTIYKKATFVKKNPIATMEVEGYGTIKMELYPDKAPNTVTNCIRLANRGFYNGLTFHRTIPKFVIQGGSKDGKGSSSASLIDILDKDTLNEDKEYNIKGEFIANGYNNNNIKHEKGIVSMARGDYSQYGSSLVKEGYNSASSQFFIMTGDNSQLDGLYAAFGKVIEVMDVAEKISNVKVHYRSSDLKEGESAPKDKEGNEIASDTPKKKVVIKSLKVETFGVDYGVPETQDPFDLNSWFMQQYGMQSLE